MGSLLGESLGSDYGTVLGCSDGDLDGGRECVPTEEDGRGVDLMEDAEGESLVTGLWGGDGGGVTDGPSEDPARVGERT